MGDETPTNHLGIFLSVYKGKYVLMDVIPGWGIHGETGKVVLASKK